MKWNRITLPDGTAHTRIVDGDCELIIDEIHDTVRAYVGNEPVDTTLHPPRGLMALAKAGADRSFVEAAADAVEAEIDEYIDEEIEAQR